MEPSSPYYQGYEVPMPDHRRPYRPPVNESFRSEREPERERPIRKLEVRRSASFHGGARDRKQADGNALPNDEFNRLYSGRIPAFTPQGNKRDVSYMMDRVKEEVKSSRSDRVGKKRTMWSTFGAAGVQFSAGFFYAATHITLVSYLVQSTLLSDNVNANIHRVVFLVFSAVASAACAALVPSARYRKLISSGAILLIFSCLSASLVTSGRFMFLPYGVLAGSAHGVLRTVSLVAATDVRPRHRVTSVGAALLGHASGGILGTFVFYHFMTDYLQSGSWTNNFRILELAAVVALLMGSMVRRPGVIMSRRAGVVLLDPGIHSVAIGYAIAFVAIGMLHYLMPVLPVDRAFDFYKHEQFFNPLFALYCGEWAGSLVLTMIGSACGKGAARACLFIGGVFVFLLGVAVMPHDPAYESFWAYMGLSFGQGLVTVFTQTFVSVGLARRMGGTAVGVAISLLMFWQDVGTMFGIVAVDHLNSDFTLNVAMYTCGGFLLFAGLVLIICFFSVVPLQQFKEPFASDSDEVSADVNVGIHNPGMGRWDGYEYDYRYMH